MVTSVPVKLAGFCVKGSAFMLFWPVFNQQTEGRDCNKRDQVTACNTDDTDDTKVLDHRNVCGHECYKSKCRSKHCREDRRSGTGDGVKNGV